jgi:hypothetical protein
MGSIDDYEEFKDIVFPNNGKKWSNRYINNYIIVEDTVIIHLNQNRFMLCDKEDWEILKYYTWTCTRSKKYNTYYVRTFIYGGNKTKPIARLTLTYTITGYKNVDHINRNALDNRKINLRCVEDVKEQECIQKRNRSFTPSKITGEKYITLANIGENNFYYQVEIKIKHKNIRIRKFFSIKKLGKKKALELAIKIRDELIKQYY